MYGRHVGMTCDMTCSLCRALRMHNLCTCSPHICIATIALFVLSTSTHVMSMWYPHDGYVRLHKCNICKHTSNALASNIFHYPCTFHLHIWGTCAINMFAMSWWTSVTYVYDSVERNEHYGPYSTRSKPQSPMLRVGLNKLKPHTPCLNASWSQL